MAGRSGDPVVDVLLGEVGESQAVLVHPGQEAQGAADAAPQVSASGDRMTAGGGPLACSPLSRPFGARAVMVALAVATVVTALLAVLLS
ncbi:hypothetical protein [Streptomyces sp. NBC_00212]|uniref:hypothetical protein n=1 Tax=Streptomyces sp. NBC_00212 TaxID=2975684 RepID=UPI00325298D6